MKKDQKKWFYTNYIFMSVLILLLFTSCPSTISQDKNKNNGVVSENSYDEDTGKGNVGGVNFKLNEIDAVSSATIGRDDMFDNKKHKVKLSCYFIGETEVTQELWMAVMKKNPSTFLVNDPADKTALQKPVETVTLYECMAFCNELTKKVNNSSEKCVYYADNKYTTVYTKSDAANNRIGYMNKKKKGFRMPTEAEWEWAALAHAPSKWAGTNNENNLSLFAWYSRNSKRTTHKVKEKKQNNFGLYDMTGNVAEFTWGMYTGTTPPDGHDPLPPPLHEYSLLVARGGAWDSDAAKSDICSRECLANNFKGYNVGLRIACSY